MMSMCHDCFATPATPPMAAAGRLAQSDPSKSYLGAEPQMALRGENGETPDADYCYQITFPAA